ncbi:MAG: iron-containing alcohol dehydrogenase [Verrucomicrobiota bacterium]
MTPFEFATAARIIFGSGTLKEIGLVAKSIGKRALVVTGADTRRAARLIELMDGAGVEASLFAVVGEPSIGAVENGVAQARAAECDVVIGFGGGSAIDAGKAIAAMLTNPGNLLDYLEIIGDGKNLALAPAPYIAIPTTSGTGAEVTRNAVLTSPEHGLKVSLRSALMLPKVALVDPELTLDLPRDITAASGLDALTQLIEPYLSCRANAMADALCVEGIRRIVGSLRRACEPGHDLAARENMALASLWSGMALANAGLGAVHGFAAVIGGMFPAPHGAVCAALLPHALTVNLRALRERQPGSEPLRRLTEVARLLTGEPKAEPEDGLRWLAALVAELQIPPLNRYGITAAHTAQLVEKAAAASSMKGNPLPLTSDELTEILSRAL